MILFVLSFIGLFASLYLLGLGALLLLDFLTKTPNPKPGETVRIRVEVPGFTEPEKRLPVRRLRSSQLPSLSNRRKSPEWR